MTILSNVTKAHDTLLSAVRAVKEDPSPFKQRRAQQAEAEFVDALATADFMDQGDGTIVYVGDRGSIEVYRYDVLVAEVFEQAVCLY